MFKRTMAENESQIIEGLGEDFARKLLPHELTERVHDLRNEVAGYKKKVKLRVNKPIEEKLEEQEDEHLIR